MARRNVLFCDRCGDECRDKHGRAVSQTITVNDKELDLCDRCWAVLESWLSRDNTTRPGDSLEWEERCACHVPCAGPCNSGGLHRRGT